MSVDFLPLEWSKIGFSPITITIGISGVHGTVFYQFSHEICNNSVNFEYFCTKFSPILDFRQKNLKILPKARKYEYLELICIINGNLHNEQMLVNAYIISSVAANNSSMCMKSCHKGYLGLGIQKLLSIRPNLHN